MLEFNPAKRKKSYYKNTNAYINAIYRANRERINEALTDVKSRKYEATFRRMVKEYMEEGLSIDKALKTISRSANFSTKLERHRDRLDVNLRGDREAFKAFRNLNRDKKGHFMSFDPMKFKWEKESQAYIYDGRIAISFRNSPYGIEVWRV